MLQEKHYLLGNQGGSKRFLHFSDLVWTLGEDNWSALLRPPPTPATHTQSLLSALGRWETLDQGCGFLCLHVDKSLFLKQRALASP